MDLNTKFRRSALVSFGPQGWARPLVSVARFVQRHRTIGTLVNSDSTSKDT